MNRVKKLLYNELEMHHQHIIVAYLSQITSKKQFDKHFRKGNCLVMELQNKLRHSFANKI